MSSSLLWPDYEYIALPLYHQNVKIFGTSPEMIDTADNPFKFSRLLDKIGVDQPKWGELTSFEEARHEVAEGRNTRIKQFHSKL